MLLETLGYDTDCAYDANSALTAAKVFLPDVILLDIGLPGANGYDVAKILRKQERFKNTKVIALTGYGQAGDRERALEAGFDYHLVKPIEIEKLTSLFKTFEV
jgi:CheY-like chemotaxis protein